MIAAEIILRKLHKLRFFFGYFSGVESNCRKVLKEDGQEILMLAISSFEAAVNNLKDGSVEFQMLLIIRDNSERFVELYELIDEEESNIFLLRQILRQRCEELKAFQDERNKVTSFVRMCSLIKQGIERGSFYLFKKSPLFTRNE